MKKNNIAKLTLALKDLKEAFDGLTESERAELPNLFLQEDRDNLWVCRTLGSIGLTEKREAVACLDTIVHFVKIATDNYRKTHSQDDFKIGHDLIVAAEIIESYTMSKED